MTAKKPTPENQSFLRSLNLTTKQRRFAREFAKHGNATQAAEDAGYSGDRNTLGSVAAQNLRKSAIIKAIDWFQEPLWELAETALREVLEDPTNSGARVRAAELLAKMDGRLAPKRIEHAHVHLHLQDMSNAEAFAESVRVVELVLRNMQPAERAKLLARVNIDPVPALPNVTEAEVAAGWTRPG